MWNVQFRGVGADETQAYWDKWVGKQVRVLRTDAVLVVTHAQMLMGEDLQLSDGDWVKPWQVEVIG